MSRDRVTRRQLLLAGVGLSLGCPTIAEASLERALSLVELARLSERALVGTPLDKRSSWVVSRGRRRIVTDVLVRVDSIIAGARGESSLVFRTLGGQIGRHGEIVHGEALLRIGESAVLFASAARDGIVSVAGSAQGHYPLRVVQAERVLAPSPRAARLVGKDSARARLVGKKLGEAEVEIQRAFDAR